MAEEESPAEKAARALGLGPLARPVSSPLDLASDDRKEPLETVPIPGAKPLSPEEQEALRQQGHTSDKPTSQPASPADKWEELREQIRRSGEAIPESVREKLRRAGDAIPQDLRDHFRELAARQRERLEGDKPPKRRPIQYSAPPSRSGGSFGVPQPGPPVPPIPTPVDPVSPLPVRETYVPNLAGRPVEQSERSSEKATMPEKPAKPDFWTLADKAMLGLCELLALLFGLPFGDDLYHDKPIASIGVWHWFYLGIAALFAVTGPMWPWLRTRTWLPAGVTASLSKAPLDARVWIAALLLLFLYGTAPEIYQRATAPAPLPSVAPIQAQLDAANRELQAERQKAKPLIPPGQSIITTSQMAKEVESLRAEINELKQQNEALRAPKTVAPTPEPASPPSAYADKTVSQLLDLCINRTALQCPSFFTDEVGKRLNAEEIVRSVWVNGPYIDVELWTDNRLLICHFDIRWKERLRTLRAPDNIKITGKIASAQDGSQLYLEACELRD